MTDKTLETLLYALEDALESYDRKIDENYELMKELEELQEELTAIYKY